eukprot:Em0009g662a
MSSVSKIYNGLLLPPDDLRERARWRLLSSKSLKGVVSKVQLNRAKNLVRGYKTAAGSVGSGDARAVDDGEGSDDGSVDHVRGSDDDGGGGRYDSGGGDSGEEGADDDGALSCDDIDLDSSTDGLGASEIQQAGRLALHSSEESDQDDYQTSVTAASSNSTGGKLSRTKKLMLTAPKTKELAVVQIKSRRSKKLSAHKKSNRLGQRARRRMWEDLHGTSAKHLINQSAEGKTVKGGIRKTHRPESEFDGIFQHQAIMLTHVISIQFIKKVFQHSDADGKPPGSELQQPSFQQSHTQSGFPAPAHLAGTPHTAPLTNEEAMKTIQAVYPQCADCHSHFKSQTLPDVHMCDGVREPQTVLSIAMRLANELLSKMNLSVDGAIAHASDIFVDDDGEPNFYSGWAHIRKNMHPELTSTVTHIINECWKAGECNDSGKVKISANGVFASQDHSNSRPADIVVFDWDQGKPAALDLTVVSPLNANILKEAGMTAGAAAQAAEVRRHTANGQRCTNLGWSCIPLAVESYGAWGREAQRCFTLLATRLAVHNSSSKSKMIFELYSRLNLVLTRSIARAIITRSFNLIDFVA